MAESNWLRVLGPQVGINPEGKSEPRSSTGSRCSCLQCRRTAGSILETLLIGRHSEIEEQGADPGQPPRVLEIHLMF